MTNKNSSNEWKSFFVMNNSSRKLEYHSKNVNHKQKYNFTRDDRHSFEANMDIPFGNYVKQFDH